jgi:hypothetical protein
MAWAIHVEQTFEYSEIQTEDGWDREIIIETPFSTHKLSYRQGKYTVVHGIIVYR